MEGLQYTGLAVELLQKGKKKNSLINFKYDPNKPSQVVKYGSFYVHIALGGDS